ncbi:MAG TPA: class I SAM-dependent methyltransferase [bacterium]|jgi:SAM-dependent methyltransferase|nr:class I SAM-dependent methyltransferase [bacterium]
MSTPYKQLNRARYEGHSEAAKYEGSRAKKLYSLRIARWVARRLGRENRILDIGGGVGHQVHLVRAMMPSLRCVAIDLAYTPLRERRTAYGMATNVQGDMEQLPFGDGAFDAVCFFAALHHSPYPLKVLSEARRILASGGSLLLVEPVSLALRLTGRGFDAVGDGINFRFSLPFLVAQVRLAGFSVREVKTTRILLRTLGSWPRTFDPVIRLGMAVDALVLERLPLFRQVGSIGLVWGRAV